MATVYCLHVVDVCKTDKAIIVSFDFGTFEQEGNTTPTTVDELSDKFPFLLKQNLGAIEAGIGVYPYGAIIQASEPFTEGTTSKLHVIPCGDVSYLPADLREGFSLNGYLSTDAAVDPSLCEVGNVYTIGAGSGHA